MQLGRKRETVCLGLTSLGGDTKEEGYITGLGIFSGEQGVKAHIRHLNLGVWHQEEATPQLVWKPVELTGVRNWDSALEECRHNHAYSWSIAETAYWKLSGLWLTCQNHLSVCKSLHWSSCTRPFYSSAITHQGGDVYWQWEWTHLMGAETSQFTGPACEQSRGNHYQLASPWGKMELPSD